MHAGNQEVERNSGLLGPIYLSKSRTHLHAQLYSRRDYRLMIIAPILRRDRLVCLAGAQSAQLAELCLRIQDRLQWGQEASGM